MPYYDIYDSNDNLIASNVFIDSPIYSCDGSGGDASGLFVISMIAGYVLAFIGMIIMLCNVPLTMMFPAICAFLIFLLIPVIAYFKSGSILSVLGIIAKNSYLFFSLLIGMWWVLYSLQTVNEVLLIGMIVVAMYSMYMIPGVLVYESMKTETKLGIVGAVITYITALVIYLVNHDTYINSTTFGSFYLIIFPTIIVGLGSIFIYVNRLVYSIKNGYKAKGLLGLALYLTIILSVVITSFVFIPNKLEKSYIEAEAYLNSEDYKEAREVLLSLGRYSDASKKYESIEYKDLEIGEKVTFGQYLKKPDSYDRIDLTWTIIHTDGDYAILFCDEIITSIDSNPLYRWVDGNNVRYELDSIYGFFSDEDKKRIVLNEVEFVTASNTFTAKDELFILSEEELKQYCSDEMIFSKDDTTYNDHKAVGYMQTDFDYDYVYSYYVRDTDKNDEWIIVDCENKQFITKNNRYVGIRPAVVIKMD